MQTADQTNGNTQLNSARNEFNDRVSSYSMLGNLKKLPGIAQEETGQFKGKCLMV